jgi:hypothetical protein
VRLTLLIPVLFLPAFAPPAPDLGSEYAERVKPILAKHCLTCHSTEKKKGDLDLERFGSLAAIRKDLRPWPMVVENLENGEMPPKKSPQPSAEERRTIATWARAMLDVEARARAGDPGRVVVRRLSNAEYNNTIRDLTGVDLEPARDFPADGAAGEGFTNAGDALVMSPTLLGKYLNAAKEIAEHVVPLPDGFRFSPSKTQRDWTDESLAELRAFFASYSKDGKLPLKPYLAAAVRHRDDLIAGRTTLDAAASKEKLNPKYLGVLWQTLSGDEPSFPLDRIRARWRKASAADVDGLFAEISAWQDALWKFNKIGSYGGGKLTRQEAATPPFVESHPLKLQPKPVPGKGEVVVHLSTLDGSGGGDVVWRRPRFVSGGQPPLLLRDYAQFGAKYEVDFKTMFADAAAYLAAAAELGPSEGLDPILLKRWKEILSLGPVVQGPVEIDPAKMAPSVALEPLDVPTAKNEKWPAIRGWHSRAGELPVVVSNASDKAEHIPGLASPHRIVVHPSPDRFVAAAWTSPIDGRVRIDAKVSHVHPGCGNGILWWVEVRRAERSAFLTEGTVGAGQPAQVPSKELKIAAGDVVLIAVDPRDGSHVCDLTEVNLTMTELEGQGRSWDLARDRADTIMEPNPQWRFVMGSTKKVAASSAPALKIPADSILGKWRASRDPKLAEQVQALLSGERPAQEKSPDRILYDTLVVVDGPFFQGLDLSRLSKARPKGPYGLESARYSENGDLVVAAGATLELRLPAALFREHELAAEGTLDAKGGDRAVQFVMSTTPPAALRVLDGKLPCVASGEASKRLVRGLDDFRSCFPAFVCFPRVVPEDETVCLKLYHRDDEPLLRLFLDGGQSRRLERLWEEHRFITQWPVTEHRNLPLFIGFVTQDGGAEAVKYFESLREPFRKRAEAFEKEVEACEATQVAALLRLAGRAYRRPLTDAEQGKLSQLYAGLRKKEMSHAEAFRTVLARILVAPTFLFRLEEPAAGTEAKPVSGPELAARLSYFLWASTPDAELQRAAAEGMLRDPAVLAAQVERMLKDPKIRGLAVEFATQWLHVRSLRQNREKNEKLFPTFDDALRDALFEETVLFFKDLFQSGRPAREILDADHSFLNEKLAKHYGIPGVKGPEWRRVDGVKKYGRGGVLALGSVLTQESGASRTSPVLRGNWLVETMLGEKLPRPPANVPRLPEEEAAAEGTVREMVARHTRVPECAVCHVRIDPFGFALEKYDPIGRLREKDLGGRPVDVSVQLKDGTKFEGLDGLRSWLLEKRKKDVERTFCQKLLGYALGRAVTLSDQPLLEEMVAKLEKEGTLSDAVRDVVMSRQFRNHRALEATREE